MDILGLTANTIHLNEQHGVVSVLHLIADYLLNKFGPSYQMTAKDSDILEAMENEFGGELSFRADVDIHQEEFYFVNSETGKEI